MREWAEQLVARAREDGVALTGEGLASGMFQPSQAGETLCDESAYVDE